MPCQKTEPKMNLSETDSEILNMEIQNMLSKNAVEIAFPGPESQFLSTLFVRQKKDGGVRPIFNLKTLNKCVTYEHFKMEGFHMIKSLLKQNDFMVKVDLKDAYLCIP